MFLSKYWNVSSNFPTAWEEGLTMTDFRVFLKPAGSNPEIEGAFYELASHEHINGISNCDILSLGFVRGSFTNKLRFRPIDMTKPVVFAIKGMTSGCYFVAVTAHIGMDADDRGMRNFKPFMTDEYLIDCYDGCGMSSGKKDYWSITSEGMTFVYGETFPDTWKLDTCDLLCAFVGGELTANQLRMHAYLNQREAAKEMRREERIRTMAGNLSEALRETREAKQALSKYVAASNRLMRRIRNLNIGWWPFMSKKDLEACRDEFVNGSGHPSN